MNEVSEHFNLVSSYKGMSGIVDNIQKYKGYFDKGTSNGSLWIGASLKPLKKFEDNFQVVATDYDQYAIIYTCTHMTAMYNQDYISILTRQQPGVEEVSEELMSTIQCQFNRIFGDGEECPTDEELEQQQNQEQEAEQQQREKEQQEQEKFLATTNEAEEVPEDEDNLLTGEEEATVTEEGADDN